MTEAHVADTIFTGEEWLSGQVVLVENGIVQTIIPRQNISSAATIIDYKESFLAPGFLDLQIYGAHGSLFSVRPTIDTLQKMYVYCKAGGAHFFQPTVATNTYEVFYRCIDAVRQYWKQGGPGVLGLHIEGPWINKEKRGAHIEALIHSPTMEQVEALLNYGKGVISMITIAPEVCGEEVIALIQSSGVIISAGHSNATYKQAVEAFGNGISTATHLFNAMSPLQHREPGMAGAIMNHEVVRSSIVPDGYHVDFAAISIAKKVMQDRLFFITDAVTETIEGCYQHTLQGEKYVSNGILSGSALTMAKCVKNAVEKAGIDLPEALHMAGLYPAQVMGKDKELGKIANGYKAAFVAMNDRLEVTNTI